MLQPASHIGIAAAAEVSGLSAHTLRAWERRYGFPRPARTDSGDRVYSPGDVKRLGLIRRLIEQGHRAGRIVGLDQPALEELLGTLQGDGGSGLPRDLRRCVEHLAAESLPALRRRLQAALVRQGLEQFIFRTAAPVTRLVGEQWADGKLQVYQEHLFTEHMERLLREAMAPLEADGGPTVVLTTLPGEKHALGLLMVEALLRLDGATCVPMGVETPPPELVRLSGASRASAIALSFSAAYASPEGRQSLTFLRRELPNEVAIWAGGSGAARIGRGIRGVTILPDLADARTACRKLGL